MYMCVLIDECRRYGTRGGDDMLYGNNESWGFTPASLMNDEERFQGVSRVPVTCLSCHEGMDFTGYSGGAATGSTGLNCGKCGCFLFGRQKEVELYCALYNSISLVIRQHIKQYYDCWLVCDDRMCGRRTMQQSIRGYQCVNHACKGRMIPVSEWRTESVMYVYVSGVGGHGSPAD